MIQKIKCLMGIHSYTVDSLSCKYVESNNGRYYLYFDVCHGCGFRNRFWNFAYEIEELNKPKGE